MIRQELICIASLVHNKQQQLRLSPILHIISNLIPMCSLIPMKYRYTSNCITTNNRIKKEEKEERALFSRDSKKSLTTYAKILLS